MRGDAAGVVGHGLRPASVRGECRSREAQLLGQPSHESGRRLDVYFPEGDLDLRVNRLVNKVFFEGQVKYNFVDGDITAFLRYRY